MKRNKVIVLLLIAFVMCTYTICMRYLKFEYLNKGLPEVKLKNKTDKNNTMAIIIMKNIKKKHGQVMVINLKKLNV